MEKSPSVHPLRIVAPQTLYVFLFIFGMALLGYAPVLSGGLVWDDEYLVGENPFYKSPAFALEVFKHYLFFDSYSVYYRPIQNWSYIFDYWLWRGNPFGYHLTNVLLHAGAAFALFLLLRHLIANLLDAQDAVSPPFVGWIALGVASLWTVHPIHNAAIAYISGRADTLAALFAIVAWLVALRAGEENRRWVCCAEWTCAALLALLALCSKEIALIWMGLFVLYLLFFERGRTRRQKVALIGGVAAVFAVYVVLHSLPAARSTPAGGDSEPLSARMLLMLRALGDYTGLIFYPARLTMDRRLSSGTMYHGFSGWLLNIRYEYLSILGGAVLAAALYFCFRKQQAQRLRVFGGCWFCLAFLPISNLFSLNAEVAEHWIYLASIGFLLLLAGVVLVPASRWPRVATGLLVTALFALGARTWVRSGDWADSERFFKSTISAGGGTPRILVNLADVYGKRGNFAQQEKVLRRTLEIFPDYMPVHINLGICLTKLGRLAEAEPFLNYGKGQTQEMAQNFRQAWKAALNLAKLRHDSNQTDEALAILREARTSFPGVWELTKYEAELLTQTQGPTAAIPVIESFAGEHWWHEDVHLVLGALRFDNKDLDAAVAAMRHASRLDIYDARPLVNIARIELHRHRTEDACDALRAAIKRDPNQPSRYLMLAGVLEELGRTGEAEKAKAKARDLSAVAGRKLL